MDKEKKYDGILCAAAPRQYPQDLISLLKNDAKLVIPVGSSEQKLNVISKISDNEIEEHEYDDDNKDDNANEYEHILARTLLVMMTQTVLSNLFKLFHPGF